MDRLKHAIYLFFEKLLHWCICPYLRAKIIKLLGGHIGNNVRIYEISLFNLNNGFRNLLIEDDVHIGPGTLIDLSDKVIIRRGAVISPRVTILTHQDPGTYHNSPMCKLYPRKEAPIEIGKYTWVGVSSTILLGVTIGEQSVIGANSLVNRDIPKKVLSLGNPIRVVKKLDFSTDG